MSTSHRAVYYSGREEGLRISLLHVADNVMVLTVYILKIKRPCHLYTLFICSDVSFLVSD